MRELESYQSVYCGLCHATGRRYGFFSRFFLNYDFVLLAMLLAPAEEQIETTHRRCIACPIRGKDVCTGGDWLDTAAGEGVILSYWKLRDNVTDAPLLKRMLAQILAFFLRPAYRRAVQAHGAFDGVVQQCLEELHSLEMACCPSIDRTADTFARILQAAGPPIEENERARVVGQILYHVGRWIYLVDAWDDLNEDRKLGQYNPLIHRYPDGPDTHLAELHTTLLHSQNLSASAYELADFGDWSGVLANILYLGLPMVEEAVFTDQWRKMKQKREK